MDAQLAEDLDVWCGTFLLWGQLGKPWGGLHDTPQRVLRALAAAAGRRGHNHAGVRDRVLGTLIRDGLEEQVAEAAADRLADIYREIYWAYADADFSEKELLSERVAHAKGALTDLER